MQSRRPRAPKTALHWHSRRRTFQGIAHTDGASQWLASVAADDPVAHGPASARRGGRAGPAARGRGRGAPARARGRRPADAVSSPASPAMRSGEAPAWRSPNSSPGPALGEVAFGDLEAVAGVDEHLQAGGGLGQQADRRQRCGAGCPRGHGRLSDPPSGAAADATAELVELGQAEAVRVLDEDRLGGRDVDADLDHGGGDDDGQLRRLRKAAITASLSRGGHASRAGRRSYGPAGERAGRRRRLDVADLAGSPGSTCGQTTKAERTPTDQRRRGPRGPARGCGGRRTGGSSAACGRAGARRGSDTSSSP
jgi:hypothetical protein